MKSVFISYRRESTSGEARALATDLGKRHGIRTFVDVDSIALGRDFREALRQQLIKCDLMLVLIGRHWTSHRSESGQSRLADPDDYVRTEISSALSRDIPVTPVLVQGAHMPAASELPDDIRDLASRQGFELSHSRWGSDFSELVKRLELDSGRSIIPMSRFWVILGFLFLAGIGGFVLAYPSLHRMLFSGGSPSLMEIAGPWRGTSHATLVNLQLEVSPAIFISHATERCNRISGKMTDEGSTLDTTIEGGYCTTTGSIEFKRSVKQNDTTINCQDYIGSVVYLQSGLQMNGVFTVVAACGGRTGPGEYSFSFQK